MICRTNGYVCPNENKEENTSGKEQSAVNHKLGFAPMIQQVTKVSVIKCWEDIKMVLNLVHKSGQIRKRTFLKSACPTFEFLYKAWFGSGVSGFYNFGEN